MELLERGGAYRDYMTVEELAAERERARAEGRPIRSPWRDREPLAGDEPAVRGPPARAARGRDRGPRPGQGRVTFRNRELDDLILLRADGSPTYNLAVVVDDHDMGITHVIRGDDHLSNTAAADPDLPGARLAAAEVRPPADDPRAGRRQALQAPRRPGGARVRRHGLPARGDAQLPGAARLGPRRRRDLLRRAGDRVVRHRRRGLPRRRGSTGPSSTTSTITTSARPTTAGCRRSSSRSCAAARSTCRPISQARLARTIPLVKEGAKTMLELADLTLFALRPRPIQLDEKARGAAHAEMSGAPRAARRTARGRGQTGRRRRCTAP